MQGLINLYAAYPAANDLYRSWRNFLHFSAAYPAANISQRKIVPSDTFSAAYPAANVGHMHALGCGIPYEVAREIRAPRALAFYIRADVTGPGPGHVAPVVLEGTRED